MSRGRADGELASGGEADERQAIEYHGRERRVLEVTGHRVAGHSWSDSVTAR